MDGINCNGDCINCNEDCGHRRTPAELATWPDVAKGMTWLTENRRVEEALADEDVLAGLALAGEVFDEMVAPGYPEEGISSFHQSITDENYYAGLRVYVAYDGEAPVGMIATRASGSHVALFFVRPEHQHQGMGRALFATALVDDPAGGMSVNAAPDAVPVYKALGFESTGEETEDSGIRFVPMVLNRVRRA